jgi:replicative DNA helicase
MAVDDLIGPPLTGPLPPNNVEAEEAVLGSVFVDHEAIGKIAPFLRAEDFYRERNGAIYAAMLALYDRREPIDFTTVADELSRQNQLEQVGGWLYLARLLEAVPTSLHIEQYGHIVERTALMRRLISAGGKIAALGYADAFDVDTTLEKAEQLLLQVSSKRVTKDFASLADVLKEYLEQLEQLQHGDRTRYGIPTGYIDLDKLTGGLQRSDLVILAARPSMGKTSLALNICANAALKYRATVGMFSLEMSAGQLAARLLSTESGVDATRLRQGRLGEQESLKLTNALGILYEAPIYVDDTPGISIMELRSKARRLHNEVGVDLLIVDYLQLVSGTRGGDNRVQEISEISRSLKDITLAEGARPRAARAGPGPIAVVARGRVAHTPHPDALRPARVGLDRAGRRRGGVHLPRRSLQQGQREEGHRRHHRSEAPQRTGWPGFAAVQQQHHQVCRPRGVPRMTGGSFPGFPDRLSYIPLPTAFLGTLLRDIDSLAELKASLHCWRLLHQQKGSPRYLRRSELLADRSLLLALRSGVPEPPVLTLPRALEAACRRGTFLCLDVEAAGEPESCYFLNTASNRRLLERIQAGEARLGELRPLGPTLPPPLPRPGIYELYEQNIGLLTPLLAEELRDAELQYPPEWVEDAFREAVAYNRRNWRYIRRILDNWSARGRGERGENRGHLEPPEDPGKYLQGRYGRLIKR